MYFQPVIHRAQGYPNRWSLSAGLNYGGKSLENWFERIHSDIVKYVHRILHIFNDLTPYKRLGDL